MTNPAVVNIGDRSGSPLAIAHSSDSGSASAVYLSEALSQINEGARFLDRLTLDEINSVRRVASSIDVEAGECIFLHGDQHSRCGFVCRLSRGELPLLPLLELPLLPLEKESSTLGL